MILTTTGFYATGSSAITDLMMEYDSVYCNGTIEIRFLHDPDCISDLEYNLIENPNRHNSSHALKRFKKQMYKLDHVWFVKRYQNYFGDEFRKFVDEYISDLTILKFKGSWHYDLYEKGDFVYIVSRTINKINELLNKSIYIPMIFNNVGRKNEYVYLPVCDEESFLKCTRKFVKNVLDLVNKENKDFVMFDQLVPPSNTERYSRYLDEIRIIVVDRDPRDIFTLEKKVWNGTIVPRNVQDFCEWFIWTRMTYENTSHGNNTLHIMFEDLIYDYDNTVSKIENHYGLNSKDHTKKGTHLCIDKSINNTRTWTHYDDLSDDIAYIEEHLSKYCYDYSNVKFAELSKKEMF